MSFRFNTIIVSLLLLISLPVADSYGQVSYGGEPLAKEAPALRSSYAMAFIEMPAFDLDSLLEAESMSGLNDHRSNVFAHKFETGIDLKEEGEYSLINGMQVWRVGIHSREALSLNLLFTRYRVPEGGQLFIYSPDYNQVVGKFDHRNNSSLGILPVRPLIGERLIVEYAEPYDCSDPGEVFIGEVNHGFRDFMDELRIAREPDVDQSYYKCMPDVYCGDEALDDGIVRSTVLLIIGGSSSCTGTLVNNTANDGTPYLLTAVHCMNVYAEFPQRPEYYIDRAGTIVAFFNYHRRACGSDMKAVEEMSVAIAHPRAIIERKDIALLELNERPPVHYNAYYAGWDMREQQTGETFVNIHHPAGAVKKYGLYNQALSLSDYGEAPNLFDKDSFWKVAAWEVGSTNAGSSGSPLFNDNNRIVGTLTGGTSLCAGEEPDGNKDYFTALYKGWTGADQENQLKTYLDPGNSNALSHPGWDPNEKDPVTCLANADYTRGDRLIASEVPAPNRGYVFGNSSFSTYEFAEEFNVKQTSSLLGVSVFIPKMPFIYTDGVEIKVYEGNSSPEKLLATQWFIPHYQGYEYREFQQYDRGVDKASSESFVLFDKPVTVGKKFFVAYKIKSSYTDKFAVYNTDFTSVGRDNTAWIKDGFDWIEATEYAPYRQATSLAIHAWIKAYSGTQLPEVGKLLLQCRYDRATGILSLPDGFSGSGTLSIYAVTGQLQAAITFNEGDREFVLDKQFPGDIGIVRVATKEDVYSCKFIY